MVSKYPNLIFLLACLGLIFKVSPKSWVFSISIIFNSSSYLDFGTNPDTSTTIISLIPLEAIRDIGTLS